MISKKRYWGLALPIYDCGECGTVEVIGGREELRERAVEGWDAFEGHTPAPAVGRRGADRVPGVRRAGRADQGRRQPVARRRDRAVLARSTTARTRTTGRSGSRPTSSPRASRASSATGSTRCSRCRRCSSGRSRSRRSSATPSCSARTGARCTRAGATRSSSTRRPTGWASTSCAGCSRRPGPRTTSCSAGTPPTRRAASCWSCGTCTRSSSPTRGWPAGRRRAAIDEAIAGGRRRVAGARPLDPVPRGRASPRTSGHGSATSTRWAPRARSARSSTTCPPGTCAGRATGCAQAPTRPTATRRSRRSTRRSISLSRTLAPILPFLSETLYQNLVVVGRSRSCPTASTSRAGRPTTMAAHRDEPLERAMALVRGAVDLARTLRAQAGMRTRQPLATGVARGARTAALGAGRRAARAVRGRAQRAAGRGHRGRLRARRATGEAAAAEDRQAARDRRSRPSWPPRATGAVEFHADGSVTLGGVTLAADEVEIQATPRPGTAVADRRRAGRRARHRADARAARRGRRPRAPARDPGPAQGGRAGPRRPDRRCGSTASPRRSSRTSRPWPPRRSPTSCGVTRRRTACRSRRSASRPATRGSRSGASATGRDPVTRAPDRSRRRSGRSTTTTDDVEIVEDEAGAAATARRPRPDAGRVARAVDRALDRVRGHRHRRPRASTRRRRRGSRRSSTPARDESIGDWLRVVHGAELRGAVRAAAAVRADLRGRVARRRRRSSSCTTAGPGRGYLTTVALALLLGGAIGNLLDRLRLRLRRRLRRHGHRQLAVLHVQRRRRRDHHGDRCC